MQGLPSQRGGGSRVSELTQVEGRSNLKDWSKLYASKVAFCGQTATSGFGLG